VAIGRGSILPFQGGPPSNVFAARGRLLLRAWRLIAGDGSADQRLQSNGVNCVTLMEVDCPRGLGVKAGVEQAFGVVQRSAFEEVEFTVVFKSTGAAAKTFVCPNRSAPLPLFRDVWCGIQNQLAQPRQQLTAPVA